MALGDHGTAVVRAQTAPLGVSHDVPFACLQFLLSLSLARIRSFHRVGISRHFRSCCGLNSSQTGVCGQSGSQQSSPSAAALRPVRTDDSHALAWQRPGES